MVKQLVYSAIAVSTAEDADRVGHNIGMISMDRCTEIRSAPSIV